MTPVQAFPAEPVARVRSRRTRAICALLLVARNFERLSRLSLVRNLLRALLLWPWAPAPWLYLAILPLPRRWSAGLLCRLGRWLFLPGISSRDPFERVPENERLDVCVVVLSTGEVTHDACLASIARQSLKPRSVKVVRDVSPISGAVNRALDIADNSFLCCVDADMILYSGCLECLACTLALHRRAYLALGLLRDPILGEIDAVTMMRRDAVGDTRYRDVPGFDADLSRRVGARGWLAVRTGQVLGDHFSIQDLARTYQAYRVRGMKRGRESRSNAFRRLVRRTAQAYLDNADDPSLVSLMAVCHGFFADDENARDFRDYNDQEVKKLLRVLVSKDAWPAVHDALTKDAGEQEADVDGEC